jgi:hypothetical protein
VVPADGEDMTSRTAEQIVREYLTYLRDPRQPLHNGFSDRLRAKLTLESDAIEQLRLHSAIELAEQIDGEALRDEFVKIARQYAIESGITMGSYRNLGVPDDVLVAAGLTGENEKVLDLREDAGHHATEWGTDQHKLDECDHEITSDELAQIDLLGDREDVSASTEPLSSTQGDNWELPERPAIPTNMNGSTSSSGALLVYPDIDIDIDSVVDTPDLTDFEQTAQVTPGRRMTQAQIREMLPDEPFTMKEIVERTGASMMTIRKAIQSLQDRNIVRCVGQDPDHKGPGRSPMRFQKRV